MPGRREAARPEEHAYLVVPKDQFERELAQRVGLGEEIAGRDISTHDELQAARSDYYTWTEVNEELLKRRFTTEATSIPDRAGGAPNRRLRRPERSRSSSTGAVHPAVGDSAR